MGHHAYERRLIDVEIHEDRVDRHDRGERRLILIDEVADLQLRAADLAGDGRRDRAKLDVEPRKLLLGPGCGDRAGIFLELRLVAVEVLLARGPLVGELSVAVNLHLEEPPLAGQFLDRADGRGELGGVGPGVDLVEQIPLGDELAVAKGDLGEIAGDAAADVDHEFRVEAARHLEVFRHPHRLRRGDRHLNSGRRNGCRGRRTATAHAGNGDDCSEHGQLRRQPGSRAGWRAVQHWSPFTGNIHYVAWRIGRSTAVPQTLSRWAPPDAGPSAAGRPRRSRPEPLFPQPLRPGSPSPASPARRR